MADKKISELDAATTLAGTEKLPVVQGGETVAATVAQVLEGVPETVRDTIGTALVSGKGITVTPNDGSDTITVARASGTSFPVSPASGDVFLRTDRNMEYIYDGTRWLTTEVFEKSLGFANAVTATLTTMWGAVPYFGTYSVWLESWSVTSFRTATGRWDWILFYRDSANAATTLDTRSGASDSDATWHGETRTLGSVLSANARTIGANFSEISGAATANGGATLFYRLIG